MYTNSKGFQPILQINCSGLKSQNTHCDIKPKSFLSTLPTLMDTSQRIVCALLSILGHFTFQEVTATIWMSFASLSPQLRHACEPNMGSKFFWSRIFGIKLLQTNMTLSVGRRSWFTDTAPNSHSRIGHQLYSNLYGCAHRSARGIKRIGRGHGSIP